MLSALVLASLAAIVSAQTAKNAFVFSIDGFHHGDLEYLIANKPTSNLATLATSGVVYSNAKNAFPSDSFPGLANIITGASPKTHGFYYDVAYSRALYAPDNVKCTGNPGADITFDESIDLDGTILTGGCADFKFGNGCGLNATLLPKKKLADGSCVAWYPHNELRVNTIFEAAKTHNFITGWADKHLVYDFVNGPSGNGVIDLYTPEQASLSTTVDNNIYYDGLHRNTFVNWASGKDSHNNTFPTGFNGVLAGGNFQLVSVAQKIQAQPKKNITQGGYVDAKFTPSAPLALAFATLDKYIGDFVAALKTSNQWDSSIVVISAKHGQSPVDQSLLKKIDEAVAVAATGLTADDFTYTSDDSFMIWAHDQSKAAKICDNVKANKTMFNADGPDAKILCGQDLIDFVGADPTKDSKVPDVIVIPNLGTMYSTSAKKDMEHGGYNPDDYHVGLIVSGVLPGLFYDAPAVSTTSVYVAPTETVYVPGTTTTAGNKTVLYSAAVSSSFSAGLVAAVVASVAALFL
ncbi:hypothetical protein HDU76_005299 [Blyttiomyces sp. JEL0837]|nr:hypothetical protein HDU76_005299 [Blyttiomyces sp. JEL0837]